MRLLFDLGHPAHVHLFRNFILYLKSQGHSVVIVTRNKDICTVLLDYYGIDYISITDPGKGFLGMFVELIKRDILIFQLHKNHHFDSAFGTSVSIGHLSAITKVKSFVFNEDDDDVVPLFAWLAYPFCTKIMIPSSLRYKRFKTKRIKHNSYHELAYLHPNNFQPDQQIIKKYGLEEGKYVVARFSALQAHHDLAAEGISPATWKKIEEELSGFKIIKSIENIKSHEIAPWDMHHILAYAKMVISDSQTMSFEAAVLGVPSIRYNTFVGRISYLEEMEHQFGLTFGFRPSPEGERDMLLKIRDILLLPSSESWRTKRLEFLKMKNDLNQWMIGYFKNHVINK